VSWGGGNARLQRKKSASRHSELRLPSNRAPECHSGCQASPRRRWGKGSSESQRRLKSLSRSLWKQTSPKCQRLLKALVWGRTRRGSTGLRHHGHSCDSAEAQQACDSLPGYNTPGKGDSLQLGRKNGLRSVGCNRKGKTSR